MLRRSHRRPVSLAFCGLGKAVCSPLPPSFFPPSSLHPWSPLPRSLVTYRSEEQIFQRLQGSLNLCTETVRPMWGSLGVLVPSKGETSIPDLNLPWDKGLSNWTCSPVRVATGPGRARAIVARPPLSASGLFGVDVLGSPIKGVSLAWGFSTEVRLINEGRLQRRVRWVSRGRGSGVGRP